MNHAYKPQLVLSVSNWHPLGFNLLWRAQLNGLQPEQLASNAARIALKCRIEIKIISNRSLFAHYREIGRWQSQKRFQRFRSVQLWVLRDARQKVIEPLATASDELDWESVQDAFYRLFLGQRWNNSTRVVLFKLGLEPNKVLVPSPNCALLDRVLDAIGLSADLVSDVRFHWRLLLLRIAHRNCQCSATLETSIKKETKINFNFTVLRKEGSSAVYTMALSSKGPCFSCFSSLGFRSWAIV